MQMEVQVIGSFKGKDGSVFLKVGGLGWSGIVRSEVPFERGARVQVGISLEQKGNDLVARLHLEK